MGVGVWCELINQCIIDLDTEGNRDVGAPKQPLQYAAVDNCITHGTCLEWLNSVHTEFP